MKRTLFLALPLFAVGLQALAGEQTIRPIERSSIRLNAEENVLEIAGQIDGKEVTSRTSSLSFRGSVGAGQECGKARVECYGSFEIQNSPGNTPGNSSESPTGRQLVTRMRVDLNSDGIVEQVRDIVLGSLSQNNNVELIVKADVSLVSDRYSWLERLAGLENKDYASVLVNLDNLRLTERKQLGQEAR